MTDEEDSLQRRWIETFGEPPALIDADLMRPILDDPGGKRRNERSEGR